jgi:hypothetical protein
MTRKSEAVDVRYDDKMERTLTHNTGLSVGGRRLRDSSFPLRGGERHPDSFKAALQPTYLAGGVGVALAGLVHHVDKLMDS